MRVCESLFTSLPRTLRLSPFRWCAPIPGRSSPTPSLDGLNEPVLFGPGGAWAWVDTWRSGGSSPSPYASLGCRVRLTGVTQPLCDPVRDGDAVDGDPLPLGRWVVGRSGLPHPNSFPCPVTCSLRVWGTSTPSGRGPTPSPHRRPPPP